MALRASPAAAIFRPSSSSWAGPWSRAAGASRLVSGSVQLLLLGFGIVAGVELIGLPSAAVIHDAPQNLLGWWAPWLGIVAFGLSTTIYLSAPRGARWWLLAILLVAYLGQLLGDAIFGAVVSGFVGAFVMTPVALMIGRSHRGPAAQVMFLPAFWMLVPGALGLIGVAEILGDPSKANAGTLVTPIGTIVAIALGVLGGTSLYRGLAGAPSGQTPT